MTTQQLMQEVQDLPLEDRIALVDSLLRGLNPPDAEIEAAWLAEAHQRADDLDAGKSSSISLEDWRQKFAARFAK